MPHRPSLSFPISIPTSISITLCAIALASAACGSSEAAALDPSSDAPSAGAASASGAPANGAGTASASPPGRASSTSSGGSASDGGAPSAGSPPPPLHPGQAPSVTYGVVTLGDFNALLRTQPSTLTEPTWDHPLEKVQSKFLTEALGAKSAFDSGGDGTTTISCHLLASFDTDNPDQGGCHWIDDVTDRNAWKLDGMGANLAQTIAASPEKDKIVFLSMITGEPDTAFWACAGMRGHVNQGGPYSDAEFCDSAWMRDHLKKGYQSLLSLTRAAVGLPKLRMVVQPIGLGAYSHDAVRQTILDAANDSQGDILVGNGNPWHWITSSSGSWRVYDGQSYADLALETGRVVAWALQQAGLADTKSGVCYGEFPRITHVAVQGATVLVDVSNPNGASTLKLPATNPTQGWHVEVGSDAFAVTNIALASPFQIRLTLDHAAAAGANASVTYGRQEFAPARGQAITDDASQKSCPNETTSFPRNDMPLTIKTL